MCIKHQALTPLAMILTIAFGAAGCDDEPETVNPAQAVQRSESSGAINPGGVETGNTVNTFPGTPPEKPAAPSERKDSRKENASP